MSRGLARDGRPWWLSVLRRGPADLASTRTRTLITLLIAGGAICTVGSGIIHLHLWGEQYGYRDIPTIGPLFLAQGIAAIVLGLLAILTRRVAALLVTAALLIASVVALILAVEVGLFGFRESWIAPYAWTTLYEEIAGALLLLASAVVLAWPPRGNQAPSGPATAGLGR